MWITGYNRILSSTLAAFIIARLNSIQKHMFNRPICPNDPNHFWTKRRGGHQPQPLRYSH